MRAADVQRITNEELSRVGMNVFLIRSVRFPGVEIKTLAQRAGIAENTWRDLENTRLHPGETQRFPRLATLTRIAIVLDVQTSELLSPTLQVVSEQGGTR